MGLGSYPEVSLKNAGFSMLLRSELIGFYPISTDGFRRAENFKSCRATLRCIRGL
jgi:hypothetical protein